jgi:5-methylcytosine-specific restriction endonuclease McrA
MSATITSPRRERSPSAYKTLILNANYLPLSTWPLSIVPAQDAVSTVWRERADVVEAWPDVFFRSPSIALAVPKVIALKSYAHVSASPKFCRRSILLRDRMCCQFCGKKFRSEELTFDHVVPKSRGGRTEWNNILAACISCNKAKRDTLPNYSGRRARGEMRPLKAPRQPTSAELLRAGLEFLDPNIRQDFQSWLYWDAELET